LTEHGCFVTNSLDGYHHLWNLEKVRLGFFSLPNLHVKLKKDPSESNAWKFAMEKIHVSKSQEEAASIIVTNISRKEKHQLFRISSTSAARRNGLKKLRTKKTFSDIRKLQLSTSQDKVNTTAGVTTDSNFSTRNVLLKSLSDTCNVENSSPNGNQPYSSDNLATAVSYSSPNKKSRPVSVIQPSEDIFSPLKTSDDYKDKLLSASTADGISAHQPVHSSSLITRVTSSGRGSGCLIAAKEKDSALMWTKATDLSHRRAGAFTETSISSSVHAGFIGAEECKILRNTCKDKEKLHVYARSQPTLFLKNPRMNTSAVFPSLDSIDKSELKFGTQTGMYKHANKHLARKGLTYVQKNGAQHSICRSRIGSNLRRVGSMIKEVSVKAHEIELDTVGMQLSSPPLHPPVPVESLLDTKRVEDLMDKVAQAEVEAVPPWETRAALSKKDMLASKRFKKHNSSFKKSHVKLTAATLESKVYKAIKVYFNNQDRGWSSDKLTTSVIDDNNVAAIDVKRLPTLTARDLLPSYKMADVTNFLRIFHDIDTNYTGVLDASEWIMFFTTLNSQVDQHYAKLMFYQIDSNGDGVLSIHELLPVVFPKANRDKLNLIEEYMDHAIESQKLHMSHSLKLTDLQCLFEHYDTTMIGFIKVGFIRQQITALQLPRIAHDEIMFSLKNIENDEMYSEQEFIRIFKPYTEK
jgi:Ca2+-binding EF-hand superfamily protein